MACASSSADEAAQERIHKMIACSMTCIRAATAGLVLLGLAANALAQSPSPQAVALARQLIDLKGVDSMYGPVLTGIILKSRDALLQTNPMLSGELNVVAQKLRKDLEPKLDALKQRIATMYASRLSEQELKDTLAFYRSPLGSKLMKVEPEVLDQSLAHANDWAAKLADEVLGMMRAEMRKKGHEL
jgi:hypothetical protein